MGKIMCELVLYTPTYLSNRLNGISIALHYNSWSPNDTHIKNKLYNKK